MCDSFTPGASEPKFTAVLCGVATAREVRKHGSFTELPVMLVKGPVALSRHVHSWLEVGHHDNAIM